MPLSLPIAGLLSPADGYGMRTEPELRAQLTNIQAQTVYLAETLAKAEEQNPDGVVYDDDFMGDFTDMKAELEGMELALQYALGIVEAPYESGLVPSNYAEDMCTGHGYPEQSDEEEAAIGREDDPDCFSSGQEDEGA